jgi:hypothetical protein
METHRIEGIKYNFDRLTVDELENIHGHLLDHHRQVTDDIMLVESAIFARNHPQLPMGLGEVSLQSEVTIEEV